MSPSRPLVSVVMPAWNAARWVEQAVTSLLVQTWRELEVIVVDDASSDATPDLVAAIADSRVRLVRLAENGGCGRALNRGLALAEGELVARLDADDYALPHRLARQVAYLEQHPSVGVVDAGAHVVDADGKTLGRSAAYAGRALHWALHLGCPIVHPAVMLRRALLPPGGYPATDTRMEDYALWLDLLPRVRFEHLAEPLIVYRRHAQAVGASRGRRLEGPRAWAERVGPRVGMAPGELTAEVARAWLNPRCVRMDAERTDPAALAELARRLDPRALALGAHVPAWKPAALARCQRVYARRALALLWHGRGDRRLVRHLGPVAAAATASALAGLGGPRPA